MVPTTTTGATNKARRGTQYSMSKRDDNSDVGAWHNPEADTYHAVYHPDEPESLSGAVIYLVSVATEQAPKEMPPLFDTIDPDALDRLFRSREGEAGQIEFEHCGCAVTAMSDGEVVVTQTAADE